MKDSSAVLKILQPPVSGAATEVFENFVNLNDRNGQLIDALPAAIYTCNNQGYITNFNKAAVELWGREPAIGKDLWCGSWKIFRKDGSPMPLDTCPMAIALKEGRCVYGHEILVQRPDGEIRNVLPHPTPVIDENGNVVEAVNMLVDITDLRNAEQAIKESEDRFKTMADQAPVIIWTSDENGVTNYINSKWSQTVEQPTQDGLGDGWTSFIHPDDREKSFQAWQEAFEKKESLHDKYRYRDGRGDYKVMQVSATPRMSEYGKFLGYIGIMNDITLQENAKTLLENLVINRTRELINANVELERSNHELEEFAYVASHDLQEPLRKISAFNTLILEAEGEKLSGKGKDYLNRTITAANSMQKLINDLLAYSRTRTSQKHFEKVNLNKILNDLKLMNKELLEKVKGLIVVNGDLPVIRAVPFQMQQLFQNLFTNSFKYCKSGCDCQVSITAEKVDGSTIRHIVHSDLPFYKISVVDNGIGFEPQYADNIFEIFFRLHGTSEYPGSGIGLAICKKIVHNHKGFITATGKPGEGSRFDIYLPGSD